MIHRYWQGEPHPLESWVRIAVRSTHPGHVLNDWGPDDLEADDLGDVRHAANVARYQALFDHGGLWLDHDVIPLRDLTTLHDEPWAASLPTSDRHAGRYEGCAMYFPERGHPALKVLLDRSRWPEAGTLSAPIRSGAYLLNEVLNDYGVRQELRVLPFDAKGRSTGIREPVAVHLWDSSSRTT